MTITFVDISNNEKMDGIFLEHYDEFNCYKYKIK